MDGDGCIDFDEFQGVFSNNVQLRRSMLHQDEVHAGEGGTTEGVPVPTKQFNARTSEATIVQSYSNLRTSADEFV